MSLRFIFYIVFVFLIAVYGLYGYKSFTKPFRILVILILCVFLSECLGRWFVFNYENSFPSYHILILLQMALYPYIYLNALPAGKVFKNIIKIFAAAGICFSLINSLFLQTFFTFPSYSILLLSLFIVCLALTSFYFMLEQPVDKSPVKVPLFWFNVGNLVFYCITFFMFGFLTPFMKQNGGLPEWSFIFIFTANIALYACYLTALHLEKIHASD